MSMFGRASYKQCTKLSHTPTYANYSVLTHLANAIFFETNLENALMLSRQETENQRKMASGPLRPITA